LTLKDLVNRFLTSKRMMVNARELTARSLRDYYVTCERLLDTFGKSRLVIDLDVDDFERVKTKLTTTGSPITVGNEVTGVRVVFNWAFEQGLIDKPLRDYHAAASVLAERRRLGLEVRFGCSREGSNHAIPKHQGSRYSAVCYD
jgi:hypothetical protein